VTITLTSREGWGSVRKKRAMMLQTRRDEKFETRLVKLNSIIFAILQHITMNSKHKAFNAVGGLNLG